jgi:hypothetical protein
MNAQPAVTAKWGLLVCQYCGEPIDELEMEKVAVLYGCCEDDACRQRSRRMETASISGWNDRAMAF